MARPQLNYWEIKRYAKEVATIRGNWKIAHHLQEQPGPAALLHVSLQRANLEQEAEDQLEVGITSALRAAEKGLSSSLRLIVI